MTNPPLYARRLPPNPAHGFPGAWLTNSVPFDGAQRYELAPDGAESETKMTNKLAITERRVAEDDFETIIVEETETGTILRTIATANTIASLAAANATQARRIVRLTGLLYQSVPLLQRCKRNISAQMPGVPHTIETDIEELSCKIDDELDVSK